MPQAAPDTLTKVEVLANLEPVVHTLMDAHAAKRVLWLLAAHLGGNTFWSTWPKRWPAEGDRHGAVLHDYASAFAVAVARAFEMTSREAGTVYVPAYLALGLREARGREHHVDVASDV